MPKLRNIVFLAFLVRILLIPFFNDNFNFWASRTFSNFLMKGFNPWTIVYHDPTLYWINPWRVPPPLLLLVTPAQAVSGYLNNEIVFLYLIKTPLILADLVTVFFLYKTLMILSNDVKKAEKLTLLYAFNPVTILVSAVWGTPDPIPVMFTTMSIYFFLSATSTKRLAASAVFLGWGIAFKLYPIFILPAFIVKLKRIKKVIMFVAFSCLPLIISSIPFLLWDFEAYVNRLLIHNLGGVFPLFPIGSFGLPFEAQIAYSLFSIVLFIIAYFKKIPLTANVVLSFLALYFALMGACVTNYLLWMLPFTIMVLADEKVKRFRGSRLLPFFAVPSIAWPLIFSGSYNSVEGVSGIFYWIYHWFKEKIIVFRVVPLLQHAILLIIILNLTMILYFFYNIQRKALKVSFYPSGEYRSLINFPISEKTKKLVVLSLMIFVLSSFAFSKTVPFEPMTVAPEVAPSTFVFYDNFTDSLLNYQWLYEGEGTYVLHFNSDSSYILLNAIHNHFNRSSIHRGWLYLENGFYNSSFATIEIIFKFNCLIAGANKSIIVESDGGWFGVSINEKSLTHFVYFDNMSHIGINLTQADTYEWHNFTIVYNNGRFIYFDNELKGSYDTQQTFSLLYLGNRNFAEGWGGACSIDWVRVTIKDFPTGDSGIPYVALAVGGPFIILTLITVWLLRSDTSLFEKNKFKKSPVGHEARN
mgnify:CR=1 FL=1